MIITDHLLMGLVLYLCDSSHNPYILAATLGGSILPDLDIVLCKPGKIERLVNHRTYSHSLFGIPFYALVLAFFLSLVSKESSIMVIWLWGVLAIYLHVLTDIFNSFGTMIWLPLSRRKIAFDIIFEFDLAVSLTLFLAVITLYIFSINALIICFCFLGIQVVYIISRSIARARFCSKVLKRFGKTSNKLLSLSVVPAKYWRWKAIIVTQSAHYIFREKEGKISVEKRPRVILPPERITKEIDAYARYARHLDVFVEGKTVKLQNLVYSPTTYTLRANFENQDNPKISINLPNFRLSDDY